MSDNRIDKVLGYYDEQTADLIRNKLSDLAATVAHEMTHLIMYDTMLPSMTKNNITSLPAW